MTTDEMLATAAKQLSDLEARFALQGLRMSLWIQVANHSSVLWFQNLAEAERAVSALEQSTQK